MPPAGIFARIRSGRFDVFQLKCKMLWQSRPSVVPEKAPGLYKKTAPKAFDNVFMATY
jgi:hypothetical protein